MPVMTKMKNKAHISQPGVFKEGTSPLLNPVEWESRMIIPATAHAEQRLAKAVLAPP